jgi:hypothetical protein
MSATRHGQQGVVSLEWVLVLPLLVLAVAGILEVAGVVRDTLLVHEAARAGVRAAATSTGSAAVEEAVGHSLPGAGHEVAVAPHERADGDLVEVTVVLERRLGPVTHRLSAAATARVEPAVGSAVDPP